MKKRYSVLHCLFFLWYSMSFAQAPKLTASGDQLYCPLSTIPIVTAFNIQNSSSSPVNAIYIQISEGYDEQNDRLELTGNHPTIISNWNQVTGKLELLKNAEASLSDLIDAVHGVKFQSNNNNITGARIFSITTGQANYLASTGHYYEYVSHSGISWKEAKMAAEARTYNGLQGYLATLTSPEEAQLCGEQVAGAGWIGGTDETTEGVWKWVTGPEGLNGGLEFWHGNASGYTPTFALWNHNQPDNAHGGPGEDYVHITDPSVGIRGAWNDLRIEGDPPGVYHPQGYMVEYGGMPGDPEINISTSTRIYVPKIIQTTTAFSCGQSQVTLSAIADEGNVYWFNTRTGGTPIHQGINYSPTINTTTDFFVSAGSSDCFKGSREKITVTVYEPISISNNITFTKCSIDNFSNVTFNLEEAIPLISTDSSYDLEFYSSRLDAESGTNELIDRMINNGTANTAFARINNQTSPCFEIAQINLNVSTSSPPSDFSYTISHCDNDGSVDGKYIFNLDEARIPLLNALPENQNFTVNFYHTAADASTKTNPIINEENFENVIPGRQEIFVRIENEDTKTCYSIGPYLELVVNDIPKFDLSDSGQLCPLQPSYEVEIMNASGNYTYEWYNEEGNLIASEPYLIVSRPGKYSVYAISPGGCTSETKVIEILNSGPPNISRDNIKISSAGDNTYDIDILDLELLGNGLYEFALDHPTGQFQDEGSFYNVQPGTHMLYINDKNGCGVNSIELFLFGIPDYFTPNGDGHNDRWEIEGIPNQENYILLIYDRYGKLLKQLDSKSKGWDGTYNGKVMPADDYWFQIVLKDKKQYSGHFSLIRSN